MSLRPTYANVVSTLALALVLSGGAYAATQLPKDSVGSKQIKQNSVKTVDVRDGDLTSADVKDGDLTTADVKDGTLTAQDLASGVLPVVPSVAYSRVSDTGTVDAAKSKGVAQANVTHPSTGVYCFSGLAFAPKSIVASIDTLGGGGVPGPFAHVAIGVASACPVGTQATVVTANNNVLGNFPFYVLLN
jgi:hypothetical protein